MCMSVPVEAFEQVTPGLTKTAPPGLPSPESQSLQDGESHEST